MDDAEPEVSRADIEKKKKAAVPSLFSPNQMARHSIMIQGHTNVREYENVIGAAAKKAKVREIKKRKKKRGGDVVGTYILPKRAVVACSCQGCMHAVVT